MNYLTCPIFQNLRFTFFSCIQIKVNSTEIWGFVFGVGFLRKKKSWHWKKRTETLPGITWSQARLAGGPSPPEGFGAGSGILLYKVTEWQVLSLLSHSLNQSKNCSLFFLVASNPPRNQLLFTSQWWNRVSIWTCFFSWKIPHFSCNASCDTPVCVRNVNPPWLCQTSWDGGWAVSAEEQLQTLQYKALRVPCNPC